MANIFPVATFYAIVMLFLKVNKQYLIFCVLKKCILLNKISQIKQYILFIIFAFNFMLNELMFKLIIVYRDIFF